MNHLKKMLFALVVAASLGLIATGNALAQCTAATVTSTSPLLRSEATVELIGTVTVDCGAGVAGSGQASISITLNPASTVFVATSATPNNQNTFPAPTLAPLAGTISNLQVIGAGTSSLTFTFNPDGVTATSYTISGLRANINASGLPSGSTLTSSVVTGGTISAPVNTLIIGVVNTGLSTSGTGATGFGSTATPVLNIAACGPAVKQPSGSGTTHAGNLDTAAPANSLVVSLKEGFASAWQVPETDSTNASGTRFRITLTGIPSGITVWAPEQVSGAAALGAGISLASTGTASPTFAMTLVDSPNADGSGGTLHAGVAADRYDAITATGGAVTLVYEAIASAAGASETATVNIALAGSSTPGTGAISGSVGFAPVGPPVTAAAGWRPQFAAATAKTVANVNVCATYLLFPYVVNTGDGKYDTGFAVSNTTADSPIGTTAQAGDVTFYFFPAGGGTAPSPVTVKTGLAAGQQATYVLSQLGAPFSGYVLAVCNFQLAHGFAFINSPQPGTGGQFAQGYLALVVSNPRTVSATNAESVGQ
jgi:hypothetical protein